MKKYLLIVVAACVALAACTKNEIKPVEVDQEITYQTIDTKAASLFSTGSRFYSWAYLLADGSTWETNYASASPYITNSLIQYKDNVWKNESTVYYWPKKAGLTFFAWSDNTANPEVKSPATVNCSVDGGIKFDNFDTSVDKNKDLLVAKIAADQKSNTDSGHSWGAGVPTVFYHILSALELKAKTDITYSDVTFNVKSVVIKSVNTKGTYTQGHDVSSLPTASSWITVSDVHDFDVYSPSGVSGNLSTTETVLDPEETDVRIFMPQTFSDETAKVVVTYQITYGTSGVVDEVTVEKDLKSIFTSNWQPGYKYTLTISLSMNQILWDPSVEEWTNQNYSVSF
ncbi:MAG: hypothetical protein ACI3ZF_06275 [Candidatus Cryptobacteroides sp.]